MLQSRFADNKTTNTISKFTKISFQGDSLPSIDTGHYALWGINNDESKILLKRFNYFLGSIISLDYSALDSLLLDEQHIYDNYEVSVEKLGDRDEVQSSCILMKGQNINNNVDFEISLYNISDLATSFILSTPTDGTESTNEKSGIWFSKKLDGQKTISSLSLPVLPDCWTWAAYVEYNSNILQIGNFQNTNNHDNFEDYSFAQETPLPIPGEDYLRNLPFALNPPINLASNGNKVFIAIEPNNFSMRLKLKYEPFWNVLEYEFNGGEEPKILITMNPISPPKLSIKIEAVELK